MKRIIIFDFNRTIYDPDSKHLVQGAKLVLRTLLRRRFGLYLISRAGRSRRQLIENLGIKQYFVRVIVAREKSKKDLERIAARLSIMRGSSFVIGDRVRSEIRIGNALGLQTVWVRAGKFADELPIKVIEQPTYTVNELRDVLWIVHQQPLIS